MKEPSWISKLMLLVFNFKRTIQCRHERVAIWTSYGELYKGYGDYHGACVKCGKDFRIIVPEDGEMVDRIVSGDFEQ